MQIHVLDHLSVEGVAVSAAALYVEPPGMTSAGRRFKELPVAASLSMRLVQTNSRHSLSQLTHETAWSFLFFILSIRSPNALEHWRHARPILRHQFRIYCARDDRHCRKLAEHADAPPYRPPIIEEDFEGAPHCDPARDQHTFSDDRRSGSGPKRIR